MLVAASSTNDENGQRVQRWPFFRRFALRRVVGFHTAFA